MISPEQAAGALKDLAATERRSAESYRYQRFSPYLFLWGTVWLIGYSVTELRPHYAGLTWMGLVIAALVVSMFINRATPSRSDARSSWRVGVFFFLVWIFLAATYAVLGPVSGAQQGAFPPLLMAFVYMVLGLWMGCRLVIAGAIVAALTLGGFFWLQQYFLLWEGFVGGAALILAGLWFRKV